MAKAYKDILSEIDIEFILNLAEVKKAKNDMDRRTEGSVYFSIEISSEIRQKIFENFGLNLTRVPMRWIKGDTKPHIDHGESNFDNTYLVYLTDSEGQFLIDDTYYPIQKNIGYVFSEGLSHETINTGSEPRLLLGPMSEQGFAVGTGINLPGGTILYIRQESGDIQYSVDQINWNTAYFNFNITNTNTSLGIVKVYFITDITLKTTSDYFIPLSGYIQYGNESLNTDGSRPVITIENVPNYPGLVYNGDGFSNGFNNIYIYNLEIVTTGSTTLLSNGGWFGKEYFAKGANNCYIVNCSSNGPIIDAGGGIVGGYAGSNSGNLQIIGCSSSGSSGQYSGGIVGYYAAQSGGNVTCSGCWSTGIIGIDGGGIFGYSAGETSDSVVTAVNCYSTGIIGDNGGGIFGRLTAAYGQATAEKCYSTGNISTDAGGIFGSTAATDTGSTFALNCYSTGNITTSGNGIYGTNAGENAVATNYYSANGTWNTTTANTQLIGVPVTPSIIGTTWIATTINQPYELLNMGYTPYTINNISVSSGIPSIVRNSSETISSNSSTNSAIISGNSYTILGKTGGDSGSYSSITINSTSGVISTTSSTILGTYTLYIRNTGSYNITTFTLIVTGTPSPSPVQTNNSFKVSDLLLDDLQNYIYLYQAGTHGGYNSSFTIYDIMLLELLNDSLIDE